MRSAQLTVLCCLLLGGCASYVTPGAPVSLEGVNGEDVANALSRQPAAPFPARLALVRVQAPNYQSYSTDGRGDGSYSVVTTRELIDQEALGSLTEWPAVADVAPLNALLLPTRFDSFDDLRVAAAKVQADVLVMHTIGTTFRVKGRGYGPLAAISLGIVPDRDAVVLATASAVLVDVRTGFVYGLAEGNGQATGLTNVWGLRDKIDGKRLEAEQAAMRALLAEMEQTWMGILKVHGPQTAR